MPFLLALAALAPAAAAEGPHGHYVPVQPVAEVQSMVDGHVDEAASQFGIFKGIARRRIAPATKWCPEYHLDLRADPLVLQCGDGEPLRITRDQLGTTFDLDLPRGTTPTTPRLDGDTLVLRYAGDEGYRENQLAFSPTGLTLTVVVSNPRLSDPIRFAIDYRRVDEAPEPTKPTAPAEPADDG